jgi:hypothetical protein
LEIEKLKVQLARLRRMQFGQASERLCREIEQLELRLEELETVEAEATNAASDIGAAAPDREKCKPKRLPLPEHLPRHEVAHAAILDRRHYLAILARKTGALTNGAPFPDRELPPALAGLRRSSGPGTKPTGSSCAPRPRRRPARRNLRLAWAKQPASRTGPG